MPMTAQSDATGGMNKQGDPLPLVGYGQPKHYSCQGHASQAVVRSPNVMRNQQATSEVDSFVFKNRLQPKLLERSGQSHTPQDFPSFATETSLVTVGLLKRCETQVSSPRVRLCLDSTTYATLTPGHLTIPQLMAMLSTSMNNSFPDCPTWMRGTL